MHVISWLPRPSLPCLQEPSSGPSGRSNGGRGNGSTRNGAGRGAQYTGGPGYGYAPGAMGASAPHHGPPVGSFYVGSPPGGYAPPHMGAMPMYGPPPAGNAAGPGVPPVVPATAGFPAATYYPQVGMAGCAELGGGGLGKELG